MGTNLDKPNGWDLPQLSQEEIANLDAWFARHGVSAATSAPLLCKGGKCLYWDDCPIKDKPLPVGLPCPVERTLMRSWAENLRVALGIPDDDRWSLMLIEYTTLWQLLLRRATIEVGRDKVVVDSYRGVDKSGAALYEKKVNPALEWGEKAIRLIQSLGRELVASRLAKAKLMQTKPPIGPEAYAKIIEAKIKEASEEMKTKNEKLLAQTKPPLPASLKPDNPDAN